MPIQIPIAPLPDSHHIPPLPEFHVRLSPGLVDGAKITWEGEGIEMIPYGHVGYGGGYVGEDEGATSRRGDFFVGISGHEDPR